ncbi:hypothetical protein BDR03DRAFT_1014939 [Suillus americanus]|nr:hypothetical protein BDR03DRAFT_1014939 [Suillus americanus]
MLSPVGSPAQVAELDTIDFGQCRDVLKFLVEPNPEQESAEFSDVYCRVFWTVDHVIEENDAVPGRPRLSYFEDERVLLVEKFSSMHEAPFNHLGSIFSRFLHGFCPSDHSMDVVVKNHWSHEVLVIGECAFAQDTDSVFRKIKYEIASHPDVLMVLLVVVDEHQPYQSPGRMSEAWQEILTGSCPSFRLPQSRQAAAQSLEKPTVFAGHTWCHLASVRFHVWVRGDESINVDVDNELLARGALFPNQDMSVVDTMIEKGMVMMRDYLATVWQKATPGIDITALRDSSVTFCPQ